MTGRGAPAPSPGGEGGGEGGSPDPSLLLRYEPCRSLNQHDAPIVACLPNGTIAEVDDFVPSFARNWMHIRTADGLEGWAGAHYLRWHSDGVRLEE